MTFLHNVTRANVSENPIYLYHASFSDFLKDRSRSGNFCLEEGAVHYGVAIPSLQWLASHGIDRKLCRTPSEKTRGSGLLPLGCRRAGVQATGLLNASEFPHVIDQTDWVGVLWAHERAAVERLQEEVEMLEEEFRGVDTSFARNVGTWSVFAGPNDASVFGPRRWSDWKTFN